MISDERLKEIKEKLTYFTMVVGEGGKVFEFQDLYDLEELIRTEQQRRVPSEDVQKQGDFNESNK